MSSKRSDGLIFLALGALVFVLLGVTMQRLLPGPMTDFKGLYFPARCLLQQGDPYNPASVLETYRHEWGGRAPDTAKTLEIVTVLPYQPTVFLLSVPFALLPFGVAGALWTALSAAMLIGAAVLAFDLSAGSSPVLAGLLAGFLLAGSQVILVIGNSAGIAIALCVVAVWCFFKRRFETAGVFCMAVSLTIKPQDAGFIWLFFLLADRRLRRRAFQSLAVVAALAAASIAWVGRISPHWFDEMTANLAIHAQHGGLADPGPASQGAHGLAMIVNLQTVFSMLRDDARFYNPATYLVCGLLLLFWMAAIRRRQLTEQSAWLALAAAANLTMLPVYHRQYDTKLLLLTVPACALLWAHGNRAGRFVTLINCAAIFLNSDLTWAAILGVLSRLQSAPGTLQHWLFVAVQVFPAPLFLLASGIAFLWLYWKSDRLFASLHVHPIQAVPPSATT